MRRLNITRSGASVLALSAALLVTAGCGDVSVKKDPAKADDSPAASPSPDADTTAGEGNWLLGVTSAGGADGETSSTVYVTYNPSTGVATASKMPGVKGATSTPEQAALLVSADRHWAIPDNGVGDAEGKSGQLKVYSVADGTTKVIDIHQRTGDDGVTAVGWAFDPERADTLRVVDDKNRVWSVNVSGGKATEEGKLTKGPWIFTNGFNRNTGEPWVESIESDETRPAGNGAADTSPVTRDGGTVLPSGSAGLAKLPQSPCRLAGGYTDQNGVTWAFCADKPALTTYYLAKDGKEWTAYGKPSTAVAPVASGLPLVLPPAS